MKYSVIKKLLCGIVKKSVEMPLYSRHACQNSRYFYSEKYAEKTISVLIRKLYLRKQISSKVIYNYIKTAKCTEKHCTFRYDVI
jgi:hypothetical protein